MLLTPDCRYRFAVHKTLVPQWFSYERELHRWYFNWLYLYM